MRLFSFQVSNYRSIKKSNELFLENYSVIIGKNNEGKTNFLLALNLAFNVLKSNNTSKYFFSPQNFDFNRDCFHLDNNTNEKDRVITFVLCVELNIDDQINFKKELGFLNNGLIKFEIRLLPSKSEIKIVGKKGKGANTYNINKDRIIQFVCDNLNFLYIPTIRTSADSMSVIEEIVNEELKSLNSENEYKEALETVRKFEQERLDEIANKIVNPIKGFLPQLVETKIHLKHESFRRSYFRNIQFLINDGIMTDIAEKGEGIKSIVTLALLNNRYSFATKSRLIAIEEPESHLHPEAIHQISYVLKQLASTSQVIISTHNPIFVDSQNISSNLIVDKGEIGMAQNISQIRNVLGTKLSDSLILSDKVIIVEGEDDRDILQHIIMIKDPTIKEALENRIIMFQVLNGANKLSYNLSFLKSFIIDYIVVLDYDAAGNAAYADSESKMLINSNQVIQINCNNGHNSELENMFTPEFLHDILIQFGFDNKVMGQKYKKENWSKRLGKLFGDRGLVYNESVEKDIKNKIVDKVLAQNDLDFINIHHMPVIDTLITKIKTIL